MPAVGGGVESEDDVDAVVPHRTSDGSREEEEDAESTELHRSWRLRSCSASTSKRSAKLLYGYRIEDDMVGQREGA